MDTRVLDTLLHNEDVDIASELINIKSICEENHAYSIPLYQRLYVWKDDQVTTLLEDLERASSAGENNYFLGGIMVIKNTNTHTFDLIDGQQRFTTLWLICQELQAELEPFIYYKKDKKERPRITFLIREFANKYFENPEDLKSFTEEETEQLENITNARQTISKFFSSDDVDKEKITKFIYENVKFIQTEMPANIDENRLFEVLNNRGIQLQHHQILKNRLLSKIDNTEKGKYAQLWDACSLMNNYIEKNIKDVGNFTWAELTFNRETQTKEVALPKNILSRIKLQTKTTEPEHLIAVLELEDVKLEKKVKDKLTYSAGKVRSIVSFPMLLLHTLRIFIYKKEGKLSENDVEINEKKLLQLFENSFEAQYNVDSYCKEFIELLWEVRVKFDTHIIKWVEVDANEEHHLIKKLYLNKKSSSLQRRAMENITGFELLQSMLYHSQQIITHYWLTPFLYKMLDTDDAEALYFYLKKLDNAMFCGDLSLALKDRSWSYIDSDFQNFKRDIEELSAPKGTTFGSYWFYKMDFILWHEKLNKNPDWKDYRMTKKNSVEHISPQNPKDYDENKLWNKDSIEEKQKRLDDFGNLVLLSVGMNSEYSNKTFLEKQTTFQVKKRLDSLKSAIIFKNKSWDFDKCLEHRNKMISLFNSYLDKTTN